MRAFPLLCGFLLTVSLACFATDQALLSNDAPVDSSAAAAMDGGASVHRRAPRRQFSPGDRDEIARDSNVCLMLRTYIVVREERNSDITRRDGEVICQPAWKFQTRSAVAKHREP
jgi:hypothetical protein